MNDKFAKWVEHVGPEKAAKRLDLSLSMVSRLKNGSRLPSLETALKIQKATRGAITLTSWSARVRKQ